MRPGASRVVRAIVLLVCAALSLVACGASDAKRNYLLGSGPSVCWDVDSECRRSSQCCSMWCVNGYCAQRDP
ncbi:MAG: hypothetical protein ABSE49_25915 [Polyangiaceae bacterium]